MELLIAFALVLLAAWLLLRAADWAATVNERRRKRADAIDRLRRLANACIVCSEAAINASRRGAINTAATHRRAAEVLAAEAMRVVQGCNA